MRHLLLLLLPLLVLGCGDKETPANTGGAGSDAASGLAGGGADVPADIASLVPGDAHALLMVSSLGELDRMAAVVAPNEKVPPAAMHLRQFGIDAGEVDPPRPLAIAVKLPRSMAPQMAFVLPAKDEAAAQALAGGGAGSVKGGYVTVRRGQFGPAGGSRLVKDMPAAPVSFRVDLAALLEIHEGNVMAMLDVGRGFAGQQLPGVDLGDAINRVVGWVRESLEAADLLEVSLSADEGWLDFRMAYVAKEDSEIALAPTSASLANYAQHVPADYPFVLLAAFDMEKYAELMTRFAATQIPGADGAVFEELMKDSTSLTKGLGSNWMLAAGFPGHVRVVGAVEAQDPAAYTTRYMDFLGRNSKKLHELMGLRYTPEEPREVASHRVFGAEVAVDAERFAEQFQGATAKDVEMLVPALMGADGPRLDMAPAQGRVVFGVGSGAIEDAFKGGGPAGLREAIGHAGGSLGFLVHVELRGFLRQMAAATAKLGGRAPAVAEGDPVPVSIYGTRHGRRYSLGLYANMTDAMKIFNTVAR